MKTVIYSYDEKVARDPWVYPVRGVWRATVSSPEEDEYPWVRGVAASPLGPQEALDLAIANLSKEKEEYKRKLAAYLEDRKRQQQSVPLISIEDFNL